MKKIITTVIEISNEDLERFLISEGLITKKQTISAYLLVSETTLNPTFIDECNGIKVKISEVSSFNNAKLDTLIEDLEMMPRLFNTLKSVGIKTLGDILKYSMEDLRKFRRFGDVVENQLIEILKKRGLQLKKG